MIGKILSAIAVVVGLWFAYQQTGFSQRQTELAEKAANPVPPAPVQPPSSAIAAPTTASTSVSASATQAQTSAPAIVEPTDDAIFRDRPLRIAPLSCDVNNVSVDLDKLKYYADYTDGDVRDSIDLFYETCRGEIRAWDNSSVGTGSSKEPKAADCGQAADSEPIGELDVRDIRGGQAWCAKTSDGQIAWIKIDRVGAPFLKTLTDGRIPTIYTKVTLWPAA